MDLTSRLSRMKITCKFGNLKKSASSKPTTRHAQYTVLTKELGVKEILAVIGFSMGGQQASFLSLLTHGNLTGYLAE